MNTYQIEILNPKAVNKLNELASLKLIKLHKNEKEKFDFQSFFKLMRAKNIPLSLEDIAKEVEIVRSQRYAK